MKASKTISIFGAMTISGQAFATTVPVSEPGMVSVLGVGAIVMILVIRHLRR